MKEYYRLEHSVISEKSNECTDLGSLMESKDRQSHRSKRIPIPDRRHTGGSSEINSQPMISM